MIRTWTIQITDSKSGGYDIVSDEGSRERSFQDEAEARADHASSIARVVELEKALRECLHVIEKGIAKRMGSHWPAIEKILPQAATQAREALGMEPRK